jgi:hypothetical protein
VNGLCSTAFVAMLRKLRDLNVRATYSLARSPIPWGVAGGAIIAAFTWFQTRNVANAAISGLTYAVVVSVIWRGRSKQHRFEVWAAKHPHPSDR